MNEKLLLIEERIRKDIENKELYLEYAKELEKNKETDLAGFILKCCEKEYFKEVKGYDSDRSQTEKDADSFGIDRGDRKWIKKWRYGFAQVSQFVSTPKIDELSEFLALPVLKFLESLSIWFSDIPKLFIFLNEWDGLKHLKRLNIWDEDDIGIGDLNMLLPKLKNLEYLYLCGDCYAEFKEIEGRWTKQDVPVENAKMDLPELRHYARISSWLTKEELGNMTNAKWPKLEALTMGVGENSSLVADDFNEFLQGNNLKNLKCLEIRSFGDMDNLIEKLAHSPLLAQLEKLSFYKSDLTIKGANLMIENREKFSHLESIKIRETLLNKEIEVELLEAFTFMRGYNSFREEGENPSSEQIYGDHFWEDSEKF